LGQRLIANYQLQITHRVKKLSDIFGRGAFFCLGDRISERAKKPDI
jgi:hypothetical protein